MKRAFKKLSMRALSVLLALFPFSQERRVFTRLVDATGAAISGLWSFHVAARRVDPRMRLEISI